MTEPKLFPNGTIQCPDCKTTMVLDARLYESPEAMAADVPVQLEHHEAHCHVRNAKIHAERGAEIKANVELQAKLKKEALERRVLKSQPMSHTPEQIQEMLRQAAENARRQAAIKAQPDSQPSE